MWLGLMHLKHTKLLPPCSSRSICMFLYFYPLGSHSNFLTFISNSFISLSHAIFFTNSFCFFNSSIMHSISLKILHHYNHHHSYSQSLWCLFQSFSYCQPFHKFPRVHGQMQYILIPQKSFSIFRFDLRRNPLYSTFIRGRHLKDWEHKGNLFSKSWKYYGISQA